jgi:hypothetical protein
MTDTLHRIAERWKITLTVALSILGTVWIAVTWADDKIKKVERVPVIEEAVLQLKLNEELARERVERIERRQDAMDEKQDRANALILEKLDKLVERRGG